MLTIAEAGLGQIASDLRAPVVTPDKRLDHATARLGRRWFRRKDYMALFTNLSTSTASRDLRHGLDAGRLETRGFAMYAG
jgi:hypothetical protein